MIDRLLDYLTAHPAEPMPDLPPPSPRFDFKRERPDEPQGVVLDFDTMSPADIRREMYGRGWEVE